MLVLGFYWDYSRIAMNRTLAARTPRRAAHLLARRFISWSTYAHLVGRVMESGDNSPESGECFGLGRVLLKSPITTHSPQLEAIRRIRKHSGLRTIVSGLKKIMKYYSEKSIGDRLQQAEEAIIIGQTNPELSEVLAEKGYTEALFEEGAQRVAAVKSIDAVKRQQLGSQVVATAAMQTASRSLRLSLQTDRRIARLAVGDNPEYADQLRLYEKTSSRLSDFILQARHFYSKVKEHPEVMALIQERYNLTIEVLDQRLTEVAKLEEALRDQQYLIGQLRAVTQQRREAMDQVDAWMREFNATARIAFQDDLANLQKLGILVRRK